MPSRFTTAWLLCAALLLGGPAQAQAPAQRSQPVSISADRVSIDERNKVHTFEGNVELYQGEFSLRSARLVVTQSASGFEKGVASGGKDGLARFSQKRPDDNRLIEGEAERIEYEAKTEIARLYERARVLNGGDEIRGHFIEYDHRSERYQVRGKGEANSDGRVRAIIQPK